MSVGSNSRLSRSLDVSPVPTFSTKRDNLRGSGAVVKPSKKIDGQQGKGLLRQLAKTQQNVNAQK